MEVDTKIQIPRSNLISFLKYIHCLSIYLVYWADVFSLSSILISFNSGDSETLRKSNSKGAFEKLESEANQSGHGLDCAYASV